MNISKADIFAVLENIALPISRPCLRQQRGVIESLPLVSNEKRDLRERSI